MKYLKTILAVSSLVVCLFSSIEISKQNNSVKFDLMQNAFAKKKHSKRVRRKAKREIASLKKQDKKCKRFKKVTSSPYVPKSCWKKPRDKRRKRLNVLKKRL